MNWKEILKDYCVWCQIEIIMAKYHLQVVSDEEYERFFKMKIQHTGRLWHGRCIWDRINKLNNL